MDGFFKLFGFVELVVVIAIIGVLAAILIPTMMSYIKKAKLKNANSNAKIVFNTVNAVVTDMQCEVIFRQVYYTKFTRFCQGKGKLYYLILPFAQRQAILIGYSVV